MTFNINNYQVQQQNCWQTSTNFSNQPPDSIFNLTPNPQEILQDFDNIVLLAVKQGLQLQLQ